MSRLVRLVGAASALIIILLGLSFYLMHNA